jgi:4-diphosphocytidyl-2-C-methyl-D-erythritol kinase
VRRRLPPPVISEFAPAKVNLALHVTGQRADGYHLLDSVVVFAGIGDQVSVSAAKDLSLTIDGPCASGLSAGPDNLVLRAARAFGEVPGASITLTKVLPVSSGIGGGSADAAAALRALAALWKRPCPEAGGLGADVPVCLAGRPARMQGIGERLSPLPPLPEGLALVLANPGVGVSTPEVFRALASKTNAPLPVPAWTDAASFTTYLRSCRNDLQAPALTLCPEIAPLLADLAALSDALMARMSGSGATCFALFASLADAERGAARLQRKRPSNWIVAAPILP